MDSHMSLPYKFDPAISMVVNCETQDEIDYYWDKLSHVPEAEQCGWVKDKFGMAWQIVPRQLGELMSGSDAEGVKRTTMAMMGMKKLVVADLEAAYKGE